MYNFEENKIWEIPPQMVYFLKCRENKINDKQKY